MGICKNLSVLGKKIKSEGISTSVKLANGHRQISIKAPSLYAL